MNHKIDKEFLILGANTPSGQNIERILSRDFKVVGIPYIFCYNKEGNKVLSNFNFEKISIAKDKVIIITSELLKILSKFKKEKYLETFLDRLNSFIEEIIFLKYDYSFFYKSNQIFQLKNLTHNFKYLVEYKKKLQVINTNLFISNIEIEENLFYYLDLSKKINSTLFTEKNKIFSADLIFEVLTNSIISRSKIKSSLSKIYESKILLKRSMNEKALSHHLTYNSNCSINLLYRKFPNETENNISVAKMRIELGMTLAKQFLKELNNINYIIPIPETGKFYAQGFSIESNIPYIEAISKNSDMGRSFDIKNIDQRNIFLNKKLDAIGDIISGKNIALVDEAVFTGSTIKKTIHLLRSKGVNKINVFIPSPINKSKCNYNLIPKHKLVYKKLSSEHYNNYFGSDNIYFMDFKVYKEIMKKNNKPCVECFIEE